MVMEGIISGGPRAGGGGAPNLAARFGAGFGRLEVGSYKGSESVQPQR